MYNTSACVDKQPVNGRRGTIQYHSFISVKILNE